MSDAAFNKVKEILYTQRLLITLLAGVFFLRLPSLLEPLWYGDEAIYLTIGQQLLRGADLYSDIFDHKTPGIYLLAAASLKIFGSTLWSFKFLLLIWTIVTTAVFFLLAKKLLSFRQAVLACLIFIFLTSTPFIEGNVVNSEILMLLPTILALLLGFNKRFFSAGILFGLAFLIKAPAFFDFAAFGFFIFLSFDRKRLSSTIKSLFYLSLGFLLPVIFTFSYFSLNNSLTIYLKAAFLFNVSYTSFANDLFISNGLLVLKTLSLILLAGFYLYKKRVTLSFNPSKLDFLVIWLFFSFFSALLAGRPYEHYLIQVIPPFSMLVGSIFFNSDYKKIIAASLVSAVILVSVIFQFRPWPLFTYYGNIFSYAAGQKSFAQYSQAFDKNTYNNYQLAEFLRGCSSYDPEGNCTQTRTTQQDHLYLFSNQTSIYFLSGLNPASKYITFYHLAVIEELKAETAREIETKQPKFILVDSPQPGSFLQLEKLLTQRYNLFAFYENTAIYRFDPEKLSLF